MTKEKRECRNAVSRAWRTGHPDNVRAIRKRFYAKLKTDPTRKAEHAAKSNQRAKKYKKLHASQIAESARRRQLKRIYGITEEQYRELYDRQGGKCALCFVKRDYRKLCIDHNHKTKMVRGLLCPICNRLVGQVDKKVSLLDLYFYIMRTTSPMRKVA